MTDRNRILVVGASGFIGGAYARAMSEAGHEVLGIGRTSNISNVGFYRQSDLGPESLARIISDFGPDLCLNASGASRPTASFADPDEDFFANVGTTIRVLEALRRFASASKYIGLSSAAVYGSNPSLPWKESIQPRPVSPYGYHKLCAELITEEYSRLQGLKTLTLRAFSVYGPGLRRQLFWDVYNQSLKTPLLKLHGTGEETRDFIYIDDVVDAITCFAARAAFQGEALNLASGKPVSIDQACGQLLQGMSWSGRYEFTGELFPGAPLRMEADVALASHLGFKCRMELGEGLKKTAAWLQTADHHAKA